MIDKVNLNIEKKKTFQLKKKSGLKETKFAYL